MRLKGISRAKLKPTVDYHFDWSTDDDDGDIKICCGDYGVTRFLSSYPDVGFFRYFNGYLYCETKKEIDIVSRLSDVEWESSVCAPMHALTPTANPPASYAETGSSTPTFTGDEGEMYYNSTTNQLYVYTGGQWHTQAGGGSSKVYIESNDGSPSVVLNAHKAENFIYITEGKSYFHFQNENIMLQIKGNNVVASGFSEVGYGGISKHSTVRELYQKSGNSCLYNHWFTYHEWWDVSPTSDDAKDFQTCMISIKLQNNEYKFSIYSLAHCGGVFTDHMFCIRDRTLDDWRSYQWDNNGINWRQVYFSGGDPIPFEGLSFTKNDAIKFGFFVGSKYCGHYERIPIACVGNTVYTRKLENELYPIEYPMTRIDSAIDDALSTASNARMYNILHGTCNQDVIYSMMCHQFLPEDVGENSLLDAVFDVIYPVGMIVFGNKPTYRGTWAEWDAGGYLCVDSGISKTSFNYGLASIQAHVMGDRLPEVIGSLDMRGRNTSRMYSGGVTGAFEESSITSFKGTRIESAGEYSGTYVRDVAIRASLSALDDGTAVEGRDVYQETTFNTGYPIEVRGTCIKAWIRTY